MTPSDRHETIAFGAFSMDLRGGRLLRGGAPVALRPKTWAVLQYLAERPGMLMTKHALLDALWPNVVVGEDTLTKSIGELRRALGDDATTPRFIETVHGRGFRFIARTAQKKVAIEDAPIEPNAVVGQRRPFVGRTEELGALATLFARASAGERQFVFVTGPAGIGKSSLVENFLASPQLRQGTMPVWVARGLCIQHHGPTLEPYMPVLEALDRVARSPDGDQPARLLRQVAPTWLEQLPRAGVQDEVEAPAAAPVSPVGGPHRMLREIAAFVEALTSDGTLVLVLEDLHWSDPSTVDLLSFLAQRDEPARLLVIGTYRPAEIAVQEHVLSQVVRTLRLHRQSAEISVQELRERDVRDYLQMRFAGAAFAVELAPLIHEHTDGNALFVVAIIDHLLSRGWILDTAPGWALSRPLAKLALGVPDDVRRLIETQLEGLSPVQRTLLEGISVGARGLSARVVAAALAFETNETELHVEALADTLRFLCEADRAEIPGVAGARRYSFAHELYRQVVYEGIPAGRRRRLHQHVGDALEAAYGARAPEIAPELAVHFDRGCDYARAAHYFAVAAKSACERFANREAIGYLEAALAAAAQLPDEEAKRRELELRVALAQPLYELHGFGSERVRVNSDRAYELSLEVGSPAETFAVVYAQWFLHAARADPVAITMATTLDDLAQRLGTMESRVEADSVLLRTAVYDGRFADAREIAERRLLARDRSAPVRVRAVYGIDPLIATQLHHAHALWFLGHPDRAQATMRAGLEEAQRSGSPFTLAAALCNAGLLQVVCRNAAVAGELAAQMATVSTVHEFAFWHAMTSILAGWAEAQRGRAREGVAAIERGLVAYRATGARAVCSYFLAFLAEARGCAGAFTDALAAVDEGLVLAETTLDRGYEPELWRLKGELLLASAASGSVRRRRGEWAGKHGHLQEAERCLMRALEAARAAQAKSLELRAAMSLARAWQRVGRAAEAQALLRGVYEWFEVGAGGADLADVRILLGELAAPKDRGRDVRPLASRR